MRLLLTIILTTFLGQIFQAQDCSIRFSGQVLDRATHEPLEFTSIAIQEGNKMVIADSAGFFIVEGLCAGYFHIQVYHLGCPPGQYFFFITQDTSVTFYLDHHAELLREILVEGKSATLSESQSKQVITSSMIKEGAGKSLAELVDQVAGVRTLRNGSGISKPIIHGLFGNRIAIINNGLIQAGQQWGADHAPEIDPNAASIITVVKGSDAIEYGSQALGGALIIDAGSIQRDPHLHGNVGYTFESNGRGHTLTGLLNSSYKKFDWRWTGTLKKAGDHRAPDYFLTNTGSSEINGSLQVIYRPSDNTQHQLFYSLFTSRLGIFAGSHISNLSDLQDAIGRETPFRIKDHFSYLIEPPKQHVYHQVLKYSGKKFIDEDIFLDWGYGIQSNHRQEFDIRRGDRSGIPALDLQLWSHTFFAKYSNNQSRIKYKSGIQAGWADNTNDYETGILPLIPDYLKGNIGLYTMLQYPMKHVVLEAGARYDLQYLKAWAITMSLPRELVVQKHTFHDVAFSLGVQFKPESEIETRWQNVIARRSPEPNELYSNGLHQGVAGIEEGNWMLQPETSFKSMLSQSIVLENLIRFELSAYAHLIYNYIYLKPEDELRLTIRGAFPVYRYTQEDAWIRGLDLVMISDFSHHLEWSLKGSLIKGNSLDTHRSLSFIPPAYLSTSISWSLHDTDRLKGTKIQLEGEYTAQQNNWDAESEWLAPPGNYFLFSVKCSTGIKLKSHTLHIGLGVENLFDIIYRNYLNRLRYFSDEQGRNISLQLRYEF